MKKIENILLNFGEIYETNDESMYSKGQKNITFEQGSWIQARISSNPKSYNVQTCFDDDGVSVFIFDGDEDADEAGLTAIGCGLFAVPHDAEDRKG